MSRFFRSREEESTDEGDDECSSDEYSDSGHGSQYEELSDYEVEESSEASGSESSIEEEEKSQASRDEYADDKSKRVSKSAHQKYSEELRALSKSLCTNLEAKNWIDVLKDLENLVKMRSTGSYSSEPCPRHVARSVAKLWEEFEAVSSNKELVKSFNPSVTKAFNVLKQKIKRSMSLFEEDIRAWQENPVSETASAVEQEELEQQKAALKGEGQGGESTEFINIRDKKARRAHRRELAASKARLTKEGGEPVPEVVDRYKKVVFEPKYEELFKHLERILYERGKKGADKLTHVQQLEALLKLDVKPEERCRIFAVIIPARIDLSSSSKMVMNQQWTSVVKEFSELMDILWANDKIVALLTSRKETTTDAKSGNTTGDNGIVYCNLTTYLKGIYKEFTRSLQEIDPKTAEYVTRMKDEIILYTLSVRVQKYFEKRGDKEQAIYAALRRLKHIYYKQNIVIQTFENRVRETRKELCEYLEPSENIVERLSHMLSKSNNEVIKTHSFLAYVYNLALNDKLYEARDLMLMSHLQNNIHKADTSTQILYNRAIVQIGLCAFRNSMIRMTVSCLHEIIHSGRSRELLAQGVPLQKLFDRFKKKTELQKTLPYFMHINVELIECIYLTCSMLLEVPAMVIGANEPGRRMVSRQFCRMIEYSERQVFVGPPENVRDHITAASFALATGDWKKCRDYIYSIKLWDLLPNPTAIKEMLSQKIREEALRTHLFTYSAGYKTIDMKSLVEYFEVPLQKVKTIVSKMIIAEEIDVYIDDKAGMIVLDQGSKQEVTKLQQLALMYCEKIATSLENNEKIAEGLTLGMASHAPHRDHRDKGSSYPNHQSGGGPRRDARQTLRQNTQGRYKDVSAVSSGPRTYR